MKVVDACRKAYGGLSNREIFPILESSISVLYPAKSFQIFPSLRRMVLASGLCLLWRLGRAAKEGGLIIGERNGRTGPRTWYVINVY